MKRGTKPVADRFANVPRFFLHVCNGTGFTEDQEGQELADVASAREAAICGLREIMAAEICAGDLNVASFIEIEDENHKLVLTVPFIEAVNVTTRHSDRSRQP